MENLVSVLIPCYNASAWLDEAIQSALSQTWTQVEVIVVDDESKDNSIEIATCLGLIPQNICPTSGSPYLQAELLSRASK